MQTEEGRTKWLRVVEDDIERGGLRSQQAPLFPQELEGETPYSMAKMLRDKKRTNADMALIAKWREWWKEVFRVEGENALNLRTLVKSVEVCGGVGEQENRFIKRLVDYLEKEWGVTKRELIGVLQRNTEEWVRERTKSDVMAPGWRDPLGYGKREV